MSFENEVGCTSPVIIKDCALESDVQIAKTGVLAKQPKRYIIAPRDTTGPSPAHGFFDDESCFDDSQGFNSDSPSQPSPPRATSRKGNIAQTH